MDLVDGRGVEERAQDRGASFDQDVGLASSAEQCQQFLNAGAGEGITGSGQVHHLATGVAQMLGLSRLWRSPPGLASIEPCAPVAM